MKKFLSLITVLACLFSIPGGACGESKTADVTYRRLYEQILTALDSSDSGDSGSLRADTATVWTENTSAAGFLFDGAGWGIRGKADMETGLITSIICRTASPDCSWRTLYCSRSAAKESRRIISLSMFQTPRC